MIVVQPSRLPNMFEMGRRDACTTNLADWANGKCRGKL
jgi:hypothetical protein